MQPSGRLILLLEVDGDEQRPIGVFSDLLTARDEMVEEACRYADTLELQQETTDAVLANFQTALDEVRQPESSFDIQFESGAGSWDYRLTYVNVFGSA